MQIFTKNATRWDGPPISDPEAALFRAEQARTGIAPVFSHGSYLVNLASPDPVLLRRSRLAFLDELRRAEALGLPFVVTHPGSHRGGGAAGGIARVVESLDWLDERSGGRGPLICLENTAGQGSLIGGDFGELGGIVEGVRNPGRLGVCLDTCHAHAAGYSFAKEADWRETLSALDGAVGLDRLLAIHLNDAKGERGGRLDRHEHLGRGRVGLEAFRLFMNEPRFAAIPMVIETPKEEDGVEMDPVNLGVLRALAGRARVPRGLQPRRPL